jgi:hypothetical protein
MDMTKEIWKDIKGYENKYQISNFGRVKSLNYLRTKKEKLLKVHSDKNGYLVLNLSKDGKSKCVKVHRLVAEMFIENPHNYTQVNHKDENKKNNNVNNLEWCTIKYNNLYGTHIEKLKKRILCVELNKTYESIIKASKELNINNSDICACCKGKLKTAGGYRWKYE